MGTHRHYVIADYVGLIPDGYDVFHTYPDAMLRWEQVAATMRSPTDGRGRAFDPDRDHYVTDGHDREARFDCPAAPDNHDLVAVAIRRALPDGTVVDVTEWSGCDEPWGDPVYVVASDPHDEGTYHDAVADLTAGTLDEQARYLVGQLVHG